jgi:OPA family glycerol-3-phosphate transporter-like MFS transporter
MFLAWSANGYFQSMLWGPLLRGISESVPEDKHYRAMFLMSTSPIIGQFFSYTLVGRLAVSMGWEMAFVFPGILLLIMAGLWYWGAGKYINNPDKQEKETPVKNEIGEKPKFFEFIVQSKLFTIISLGILIGIAREGLTVWGPALFTELYSLDMKKTLAIMSFMPLINLLFVMLGGLLHKKNNGNEGAAILLFITITMLSALSIWRLKDISFPLKTVLFYGLMASLYAINILMTSYIPFRYKQKGRVSAAAGIIDCSLYLGAAIAGPLIGTAAEKYGWEGIFTGILGISILAFILCLLRKS